MREDYVPNEKYRNMFGVERNGYGMERVDLYLAQLEVAFKKIREDNRGLKRDLAEQANQMPMGLMPHSEPSPAAAAQLEQQEQYIQQLQAQLSEQQEQNRRLGEQLSQAGAAGTPPQIESLMAQINALRAEADMLRQQLRRAPEAPAFAEPMGFEGDKQSLIGKVLIEARAQADETLRTARQEADRLTRQARQQAETLRAEQDRIMTQLQGVSYSLRNMLRDSTQTQFDSKRGEELAAG